MRPVLVAVLAIVVSAGRGDAARTGWALLGWNELGRHCNDGVDGAVFSLLPVGGAHGMHPVGQDWVAAHPNAAENNASRCQACHGVDYRGTVLSRACGDRTLDTRFGRKTFWKGFQVGCYTCHSGPSSENANPNAAPVVTDALGATPYGTPLVLSLVASDVNGDALDMRIVRQPAHGAAGLAGRTVTYIPEPGFVGRDAFTFAAWDGSTDSNLGTAAIDVADSLAPTPTPTPAARKETRPVVPPPAPRWLTPRP